MADRYALAAVEVPPDLPAQTVPSLYAAYRETLETGLAQRGPLLGRKVWRAGVLGDLNIFQGTPEPSSRIRASAILLWDWSGSQGPYLSVLIHGLQAITASLIQLRMQVWAGAYSGTNSLSLETEHNAAGCVVGIVKGFQDTFDPRRVATLANLPCGGTPTGIALQYVRERVLPQTGQGRKRLFVIATDGEADNVRYQAAEIRRLRSLPDLSLVALYCGDKPETFASMRQQFPTCFWAPDRTKIPEAFSHTLRAFRGGL